MASFYEWLYTSYFNLWFNTGNTLLTNLVIILVGRLIYAIIFWANYLRVPRSRVAGNDSVGTYRLVMGRTEKNWFIGREIGIIIFGMLSQSIAIFFLAWSFLVSAQYLGSISARSPSTVRKIILSLLRIAFYVAVGVGFMAYVVIWLTGGSWGAPNTIAIIGGIGVFFIKDLQVSRFTSEQLSQYFTERRFLRVSHAGKVALLILFVAVPFGWLAVLQFGGAPVITHYNVLMFDGITLGTDVYRNPWATGPEPVVLIRTPYNKDGVASSVGSYLAEGFTVVLQDTRGKFSSQGDESRPFFYDAIDGNYTINWILQQPFCNGKIVTIGGSALGIVQYALAGDGPNGLVFQSIQVATPELYDYMGFPGGVFRKSLFESWLWAQFQATQTRTPYVDTYGRAIANLFDHPTKDSYWDNMSLSSDDRVANVNWSALHYGGWYDIFSQGIIDGFTDYQYLGGVGARGHQRLVMGPWIHGGIPNDIKYPTGNEPYSNWETEMQNAAVFGTSINWNDPCVAYYLMGDLSDPNANYWRIASKWPLDHADDAWYFQAVGSLSNTTMGTNKNFTYLYDPHNPVLTWGGNELVDTTSVESDILVNSTLDHDHTDTRLEYYEGTGPKNQYASPSPELNRPDVLEFTTANLTAPVEVVGRISSNLTVASNCTDTMFTVKLIDVYPDGRAYNVVDGALLMRRRDGDSAPDDFMTPGTNYTVSVDLWSSAYRFATNHCIKVAISSSNFPRFEICPNTNATLGNHPLEGTVDIAN